MKIYILFFLFSSSFDAFSSTPVTKKQLDPDNVSVAKLESSIKAIIPQVQDYFLKIHRQADTVEKKQIAATPKSIGKKELIADTYASSNRKNNVKHLGNATEIGYEGSHEKAKTGGKSKGAYDDALLKMKSSMHDYFSMMNHFLQKLEEKRNEKSNFTSTSEENKEHATDVLHLISNVKNNSKHLNNTTNGRHHDDLSKIETEESSFNAYDVVMQDLEYFMNVIMPEIRDYFSNMYAILQIQPEERDAKSLAKNKEHKEEVHANPDVLNDKKDLNNASNNQRDTVHNNVKTLFDVYNDEITKRKASIEVQVPKIEDYLLKKHHIFKRHIGKGEEKSMAASKSTEKKQHIAKENTSSSVKNEGKKFGNEVKYRRENEISNPKISGKSVKNHLDEGSKQHILVAFPNNIASGNETFIIKSAGRNSDNATAINSTKNELSSDRKNSKVNFSQKEILNSNHKDATLKNKQHQESSNKIDYKLTQADKNFLGILSTDLIIQNERSSVSGSPGKELLKKQYSEELETKKSATNTESLKNAHKINDGSIVTASTNITAGLTSPKENNRMTSKIANASEDYQKNLIQKSNATSVTAHLMDEDQINITRSKMLRDVNKVINPVNSYDKTSSLTSTISHSRQHKENSTKETRETSQKIEIRGSDQQMTKNEIMNHSTSASKLNDSDTKSPLGDKKNNLNRKKSPPNIHIFFK